MGKGKKNKRGDPPVTPKSQQKPNQGQKSPSKEETKVSEQPIQPESEMVPDPPLVESSSESELVEHAVVIANALMTPAMVSLFIPILGKFCQGDTFTVDALADFAVNSHEK